MGCSQKRMRGSPCSIGRSCKHYRTRHSRTAWPDSRRRRDRKYCLRHVSQTPSTPSRTCSTPCTMRSVRKHCVTTHSSMRRDALRMASCASATRSSRSTYIDGAFPGRRHATATSATCNTCARRGAGMRRLNQDARARPRCSRIHCNACGRIRAPDHRTTRSPTFSARRRSADWYGWAFSEPRRRARTSGRARSQRPRASRRSRRRS